MKKFYNLGGLTKIVATANIDEGFFQYLLISERVLRIKVYL